MFSQMVYILGHYLQTHLAFHMGPFGGYGPALLVGFSKKPCKTVNLGAVLGPKRLLIWLNFEGEQPLESQL